MLERTEATPRWLWVFSTASCCWASRVGHLAALVSFGKGILPAAVCLIVKGPLLDGFAQ